MTDVPKVIVFAYLYETDGESSDQFADFSAWVAEEDIDGTSAYRIGGLGGYRIAVVDVTGGRALREFEWKGEPHELSSQEIEALLNRIDRFAGKPAVDFHYGPDAGPKMNLNPDGTWTVG